MPLQEGFSDIGHAEMTQIFCEFTNSGLYDKDPKLRGNEMINLCGTAGGPNDYVVERSVNLFVQRSR
jgi:hypothetical protein